MTTQSPMVRCERCHKVRDRPGSPWSDHPAKIPGEVLGVCRLCSELLRLLLKRKWDDEGRKLLQDRKRGYGSLTPVGDVFKGFRDEAPKPKGEEVKRDDVFKSNFINAATLKGKKVPVTIESVEMETVGQGDEAEEKAVAHFRGKEQGLVLNMTNWDTLQELLGSDDTDKWIGKTVLLVPARVKFGKKMVDAVRIEPYRGATRPSAPPPPPEPEPESEEFTAGDDDIPFSVLLPFFGALPLIGALIA